MELAFDINLKLFANQKILLISFLAKEIITLYIAYTLNKLTLKTCLDLYSGVKIVICVPDYYKRYKLSEITKIQIKLNP